jgi:hypothetical protein
MDELKANWNDKKKRLARNSPKILPNGPFPLRANIPVVTSDGKKATLSLTWLRGARKLAMTVGYLFEQVDCIGRRVYVVMTEINGSTQLVPIGRVVEKDIKLDVSSSMYTITYQSILLVVRYQIIIQRVDQKLSMEELPTRSRTRGSTISVQEQE